MNVSTRLIKGASQNRFLNSKPKKQLGLLSCRPILTILRASMDEDRPRIVIVGGGLAGLTSALTASSNPNIVVTLIEKEPKLGGNSKKASSGMSAVASSCDDTTEDFIQDTLKSGGGLSNPALVKTLADDSADAIAFLEEKTGLNLTSNIVQLGGHSRKRTHTDPAGPIGFDLMRSLEARLANSPNVEVITAAKVIGLLLHDKEHMGGVRGLIYKKLNCPDGSGSNSGSGSGGEEGVAVVELDAAAVVLASGGFGANAKLLQNYCGDVLSTLPTTNGPWATGDLLEVSSAVGAALIHCECVQVHPTGFVDPGNPESKSKILAAEKLRGVGGLLFNEEGQRFVNELTTRDVVADAVMKQKNKQAFIVLDAAAAAAFGGAMNFYIGKGLFKRFESVEQVAERITGSGGEGARDCDAVGATIKSQIEAYNKAATSGGPDGYGKTVFPQAGFDPSTPIWFVAEITPVIHYCMGGVAIDSEAHVLNQDGSPIPGLFAAGEVTGGVHGKNRLAGNSLLECVVFGRKAGQSAVMYTKWSHWAVHH